MSWAPNRVPTRHRSSSVERGEFIPRSLLRQQVAKKSLLQAAQKDPDARRMLRDRVRETCPEVHEHANTNTNSREASENNGVLE